MGRGQFTVERVRAEVIKTKIITVNYFLTSNYGWENLETRIEKFLNSQPMEIIDIQFSAINIREEAYGHYCAQSYTQKSAMIIYKEIKL